MGSPPLRGRPWSNEELIRLRELVQTLTIPKICEALGRTHGEVRHRIRAEKLSTKSPGERSLKEVRQIVSLSNRWGIKQAAVSLQLTEDIVCNVRRRYARIMKEHGEAITEKSFLSLRGAALRFAHRMGCGQMAEEFASFACFERITVPVINLTITWRKFRTEYFCEGDSRMQPVLEDPIDDDGRRVGVQAVATDWDDSRRGLLALIEDAGLTELERCLVVMKFEFENTLDEIGFALNLDALQVQTWLNTILAKMRSQMEGGLNAKNRTRD